MFLGERFCLLNGVADEGKSVSVCRSVVVRQRAMWENSCQVCGLMSHHSTHIVYHDSRVISMTVFFGRGVRVRAVKSTNLRFNL